MLPLRKVVTRMERRNYTLIVRNCDWNSFKDISGIRSHVLLGVWIKQGHPRVRKLFEVDEDNRLKAGKFLIKYVDALLKLKFIPTLPASATFCNQETRVLLNHLSPSSSLISPQVTSVIPASFDEKKPSPSNSTLPCFSRQPSHISAFHLFLACNSSYLPELNFPSLFLIFPTPK